MNTNREYGKLSEISGQIELEYAPSVIRRPGKIVIYPTQQEYLEEGFKRVLDYRLPDIPEHSVQLSGYEQDDMQISVMYKYVEHQYTIEEYDAALERHLTETRCARGYTTREPTLYMTSSNPRWAQDARDWTAFVDEVMEYGLSVQNDYIEGKPVPAYRDFVAALPQIKWTYELSSEVK